MYKTNCPFNMFSSVELFVVGMQKGSPNISTNKLSQVMRQSETCVTKITKEHERTRKRLNVNNLI